MSTPLITLNNVSVVFDERNVLDRVSFSLSRNKITTLIGPNGAGKSTLVKTVIGLTRPTEGSVERIKGLKVGYVPQKLQLNPSLPLTVERFLKLSPLANANTLDEALQLVNARHLLHSNMHTLSGGKPSVFYLPVRC